MIPATLSPETESRAEGRMFYALRDSLDNSYTIFHSFDLPTHNLKNRHIDVEIDFLVLSHRQGLLVLEVKGGSIKHDGERWYQNAHPLEESPYRQAERNKYAITTHLERRFGKHLPMIAGHAVCFPDVYTKMDALPHDDEKITITGSLVPHVDTVIPAIMNSFKRETHRDLSDGEAESIRKALIPEYEYGTSLADMIGAAEQKIFKLTEEQCNLLDFLGDRKRVLVKGCAGTGKTVLAMKKARELGQNGKRVLFLCYNVPLRRLLEKSLKNLRGDITAGNYHNFCMKRLEAAGIYLPESSDRAFWEMEIPDAFDKLLENQPLKYDAIIVDEGQDFMAPYWITIERMLAPNGYFYIFYDPGQNLYKSDLQFPINEEPFELKTNCRNTRQICNLLTRYTSQEMKVKEDAPEGTEMVDIARSSDRERRKELSRLLHKLVNEEGVAPERIVILGGHTMEHTCIGDNAKVGNFTIERDPEEGSHAIRYDTYMRFKGCEADAVILLDVDPKDARWDKNAFYAAMSRAKFLLYVLYRGGNQ
jgi:hypothetical protein